MKTTKEIRDVATERGLERKIAAIKNTGGGCSICGYKKNVAALQFHHRNLKEKMFALDLNAFTGYSWVRIESELAKCVLLCGNCHAALHNPEFKK